MAVVYDGVNFFDRPGYRAKEVPFDDERVFACYENENYRFVIFNDKSSQMLMRNGFDGENFHTIRDFPKGEFVVIGIASHKELPKFGMKNISAPILYIREPSNVYADEDVQGFSRYFRVQEYVPGGEVAWQNNERIEFITENEIVLNGSLAIEDNLRLYKVLNYDEKKADAALQEKVLANYQSQPVEFDDKRVVKYYSSVKNYDEAYVVFDDGTYQFIKTVDGKTIVSNFGKAIINEDRIKINSDYNYIQFMDRWQKYEKNFDLVPVNDEYHKRDIKNGTIYKEIKSSGLDPKKLFDEIQKKANAIAKKVKISDDNPKIESYYVSVCDGSYCILKDNTLIKYIDSKPDIIGTFKEIKDGKLCYDILFNFYSKKDYWAVELKEDSKELEMQPTLKSFYDLKALNIPFSEGVDYAKEQDSIKLQKKSAEIKKAEEERKKAEEAEKERKKAEEKSALNPMDFIFKASEHITKLADKFANLLDRI